MFVNDNKTNKSQAHIISVAIKAQPGILDINQRPERHLAKAMQSTAMQDQEMKKTMLKDLPDLWNQIGYSQMDMIGTGWVKLPKGVTAFTSKDGQWQAKQCGLVDWTPTSTPYKDAQKALKKFDTSSNNNQVMKSTAMKAMKAMKTKAMKPMKAMKSTSMKAMKA